MRYVVLYTMIDGRLLYHSRTKGDFCPVEEKAKATIFKGLKYAEREADRMLEENDELLCYSIREM